MKTHRMSRSTETRNAHKEMAVRGRASLSRGELFAPDQVLTGRRFRRANKLTRTEAALLNVLVRRPDGTAIRPTVNVEIDDNTCMITSFHVS